jgi:hypothetical protein
MTEELKDENAKCKGVEMDEGRRKRTAGGIDICKRLFLP